MQCYLCHRATEFFKRKNGYEIFVCPSCGLKSTQLTESYEEFIEKFYTKGYYTGTASYAAYSNYLEDKPYITKTQRKFLAKIKLLKPALDERNNKRKLLDVGCAMGFFVEMGLREGYDAYGFDPSDYATHKAKDSLDGRIAEKSIHTVHYEQNSFDVITMLDVVEHLGDPIKDLAKLTTFMKDDGIMLIATGDTKSVAARTLGRRWTFYIPPQHLFFFDKTTFTEVLRRAGLIPISWFRVGKWLSLRYILHLARTTGESKFAELLYPLVVKLPFGKIPLYLPLRDNMIVMVKKKP